MKWVQHISKSNKTGPDKALKTAYVILGDSQQNTSGLAHATGDHSPKFGFKLL